MGVPTACKRYTMKIHSRSGAYKTVKQAQEANVQASMVIIDFTYVIKYTGGCVTGAEYFSQKFFPEYFVYFERGCRSVILAFDRFSPPNKYETQLRRYSGVTPHRTPTNARELSDILYPGANLTTDLGGEPADEDADPERLSLREFVATDDPAEGISALRVGEGIEARSAALDRIDGLKAVTRQRYAEGVEPLDIPEHRSIVLREAVARVTARALSGDPAALLPVTDLTMPGEKDFKRCMANSQLKAEFLHYLTLKVSGAGDDLSRGMAGIYTEVNRGPGASGRSSFEAGRRVPFGASLCLHGMRTRRPERGGRFGALVPPDASLTTVRSAEERGRITQVTGTADEYHPPEVLANIGEGEIACMYYSLQNLGTDQLLVTVDGDVPLLALLASKRRLEADGKTFRNKVHVLLKNPSAASRKKGGRVTRPRTEPKPKDLLKGADEAENRESLEGGHLYVDVNALYFSVCERGPFSRCVDPVATHVAVSALMGNDYILGFAPGLASGSDTVHEIPWVFLPFVNQLDKFATMVSTVVGGGVRAPWRASPRCEAASAALRSEAPEDEREKNPRLRSRLSFDGKTQTALDVPACEMDADDRATWLERTAGEVALEKEIVDRFQLTEVKVRADVFRLYVYACYYYKYKDQCAIRKAIEKAGGLSEKAETDPTDEDLETCAGIIRKALAGRKTSAMMSEDEILAFSRRLEWLLDYWSNSYVDRCEFPNPAKTVEGKSYYGWTRPSENPAACVRTNDVYKTSKDRKFQILDLSKEISEEKSDDPAKESSVRQREKGKNTVALNLETVPRLKIKPVDNRKFISPPGVLGKRKREEQPARSSSKKSKHVAIYFDDESARPHFRSRDRTVERGKIDPLF